MNKVKLTREGYECLNPCGAWRKSTDFYVGETFVTYIEDGGGSDFNYHGEVFVHFEDGSVDTILVDCFDDRGVSVEYALNRIELVEGMTRVVVFQYYWDSNRDSLTKTEFNVVEGVVSQLC